MSTRFGDIDWKTTTLLVCPLAASPGFRDTAAHPQHAELMVWGLLDHRPASCLQISYGAR